MSKLAAVKAGVEIVKQGPEIFDSVEETLNKIAGERRVICMVANTSSKDLKLVKVFAIHGKLWEVSPPNKITAGTIGSWVGIKGSWALYGTHLAVIYSDGINEILFGAENPLKGSAGINSLIGPANYFSKRDEDWINNCTNGKYPSQRSETYHKSGNVSGSLTHSDDGVSCKWSVG